MKIILSFNALMSKAIFTILLLLGTIQAMDGAQAAATVTHSTASPINPEQEEQYIEPFDPEAMHTVQLRIGRSGNEAILEFKKTLNDKYSAIKRCLSSMQIGQMEDPSNPEKTISVLSLPTQALDLDDVLMNVYNTKLQTFYIIKHRLDIDEGVFDCQPASLFIFANILLWESKLIPLIEKVHEILTKMTEIENTFPHGIPDYVYPRDEQENIDALSQKTGVTVTSMILESHEATALYLQSVRNMHINKTLEQNIAALAPYINSPDGHIRTLCNLISHKAFLFELERSEEN